MSINRWGLASVIALVAVLPIGALAWQVGGPHTLVAEMPPVILMIAAVICSTAAAIRGSRGWLTITVVAAIWSLLTLFLIFNPE